MKTQDRYNRAMRYWAAILLGLGLIVMQASAIQNDQNSEAIDLQEILKRLSAHDEWQNRHLIEYQVHRKFHASNPRFNKEAILEVKTSFRQPGKFESQVVRSEGSD